jgi:hypothetical protein
VKSLPPGSCLVAAMDRIDDHAGAGEWQDPALLEQFVAQARRVTLMEGERMTTTLRLIRRWHLRRRVVATPPLMPRDRRHIEIFGASPSSTWQSSDVNSSSKPARRW